MKRICILLIALASTAFAGESVLFPDIPMLSAISNLAPTEVAIRYIVNAEYRSAKLTRSGLDGDRSHFNSYFEIRLETPDWGDVGVGYWNDSSIGKRDTDYRRRLLHENNVIPYYRYTWRFNDEWNWRNEIHYTFQHFNGYRRKGRSPTSTEYDADIYYFTQVDNPYVAPFLMLRRMVVADNRFDFRFGALRSIPLIDELKLTPSIFFEGGNSNQVQLRYGSKRNGRRWHNGINSMLMSFLLSYPISDIISIYGGCEYFHMLRHDVRDIYPTGDDPRKHNDILIGVAGIAMNF